MYSAVILCGGKSSRMGFDKRMLPWRGKPLLQQLVEGFPDCEDLFLSVRDPPQGFPTDIRSVPDLFPGCGPLAGLHAALSAMRNETLFVTTCDAPLVDYQTANALLPLLGSHDAVISRSGNQSIHPLIAVYRRDVLEKADDWLRHGKLKMRAFVAELDVIYASSDLLPYGELTLTNLNTPEDLLYLEAEIGISHYDISRG